MLRKQTALYALLAMYEIARLQRGVENPRGVLARDIAEKYKLPKAFTAKILSQLAAAEILRSDRGPGGGFRLERPIDDITLFDLFMGVEAVTGLEKPKNLVKGMPRAVQTVMNNTLDQAAKSAKEILMSRKLSSLFKK